MERLKAPIQGPKVSGLLVHGEPVYAWLDYEGGKYGVFDRVALEDKEGRTPLAQMRLDEFMTYPGVIYREAERPIAEQSIRGGQ